nr:PREDICTED: uncharacterized protein LOC103559767 [Equus przewalskii]
MAVPAPSQALTRPFYSQRDRRSDDKTCPAKAPRGAGLNGHSHCLYSRGPRVTLTRDWHYPSGAGPRPRMASDPQSCGRGQGTRLRDAKGGGSKSHAETRGSAGPWSFLPRPELFSPTAGREGTRSGTPRPVNSVCEAPLCVPEENLPLGCGAATPPVALSSCPPFLLLCGCRLGSCAISVVPSVHGVLPCAVASSRPYQMPLVSLHHLERHGHLDLPDSTSGFQGNCQGQRLKAQAWKSPTGQTPGWCTSTLSVHHKLTGRPPTLCIDRAASLLFLLISRHHFFKKSFRFNDKLSR